MGNLIKKLFILLTSVIFLMGYQNCSQPKGDMISGDDFQQSVQPTIENEGNGAGYTGKLSLVAPNSVADGQSFLVSVTGGTKPYQFSLSNGTLNAVPVDESHFELTISMFPGETESVLSVEDAKSEKVSTKIEIVVNDDVYNYSYAGAGVFTDEARIVYDQNLHLILVFDNEGHFVRSLSPGGQRREYFSNEVDIVLDHLGRLVALDTGKKKIHFYGSDLVFLKTGDLNSYENSRFESVSAGKSNLFLVDSIGKKVFRWVDAGNSGTLSLHFQDSKGHLQSLSSVAFSGDEKTLFLSDPEAREIKVFKDNELEKTLTHVSIDGQQQRYRGPRRLLIVSEDSLLVQDSIFLRDEYAGKTSGYMGEEKTLVVNHLTGVGRKIEFRQTSGFHAPTDCLSVFAEKISFCNPERVFTISDVNGNQREETYPSLGPINSVKDPWSVAVDDLGNYFVTSVWHYVVGLNKDNEVIYRAGGHGDLDFQNAGIADLEVLGEKLYLSNRKGNEIQVFDKNDFTPNFQFWVPEPREFSIANNLLFILSSNNSLLVYDLNGKLVKSIDRFYDSKNNRWLDFRGARDIFARSTQEIYIINDLGTTLYEVNLDGEVKKQIFPHENLMYLTGDQAGRLFVSQGSSILILESQSGKVLQRFGMAGVEPGAFNGIRGLDIDNSFLYVTDHFNQRVQKISLTLFSQ